AGTVNGVNLNLQPGGAEIRGRVTRIDNGQAPLPGVSVNLRGPWPRSSSVTPASALTNEQGDYTIVGVPPGRYMVEADRFQVANGTAIGFYPQGAISRPTAVPITVLDGTVTTVDVPVTGFTGGATPRAIRGFLKDSNNQPIRDAIMFAAEPTGTGGVRFVAAFEDGSFVVDGLTPGLYVLAAQVEKTAAWFAYPAETTVNTGALLDLTAGDVNGINFI